MWLYTVYLPDQCSLLHCRATAGVKDSAATSQAIITGGAIAGASFALFQTHPQHPDKPLIQFDLALVLIPSLLLGTSIGTPIPDYLRSEGPQANCCLSSAASLDGLGNRMKMSETMLAC